VKLRLSLTFVLLGLLATSCASPAGQSPPSTPRETPALSPWPFRSGESRSCRTCCVRARVFTSNS